MKAKIQHEIQEYCSLLRLNAISEHFEEAIAGATDYEGFLHQLLRMEVDAEEERAKERKIKAAKFPYRKYIEDLEMDLLPEGMRNRLPELCSLDFIREGKNIIMTGNPGTGKTHTAIGLGIKACECQTAHCGRGKSHFIFGGLVSPIVPYWNLTQTTDGITADCRSLV